MIDFRFGRCGLVVCTAIAMLAGCSGHTGDGVVPSIAVPDSFPYHKTFNYTGMEQDFKVPAGVTQLKVTALGAHGAYGAGSPEALGGRVHAVIPVTPGETLAVYVGGNASGENGGFNGGANSGSRGSYYGYGGGASDVRRGGDKLADRILVAGGGGGQGSTGYFSGGAVGGKGGGYTGGSGASGYREGGGGGGGGTQHRGGSGGSGGTSNENRGSDGTLGAGGTGGTGCSGTSCEYGGSGGGGGGGYYGGGGGGTGWTQGQIYVYGGGGGGGGGGSSYAERRASDVHMWQGWKKSAGNGLVVISW